MDPELRARLRGLSPGSREYQAAIDAYNREKAAQREREMGLRQQEEEQRAAREERRLTAERGRAAATAREAEERQNRERIAREEAERQTAMVTAASTGGGLAAGVTGGYLADKYVTPRYRGEMGARAAQIRELAGTARGINPASPGARAAYGDVVSAAERGNLLRRPIPWGTGLMAGGLAGMGAYSTFGRAPEARSDIERALWTGTGYGELGAATKLAAGSVNRYRNPGVAYPATDVAAIEGARRIAAGGEMGPLPGSGGDPQASAAAARAARQTALLGSTGDVLKEQARKLKLPVSGTKAALAARILDHEDALARGETPAVKARRLPRATKTLLPLLAGGLAYDAATSGAEAAEMTPGERRTRGLLAGGIAGGTTAGIPYALERAGAGAVLPGLGTAAMPEIISGMTDYSPGELAQGRNVLARYLPSALRGGAVEEAYQMAQVPDRGERPRMPLGRAAMLEIPGNIPEGAAARADQQSGFDAAVSRLLAAIDEHNATLAPPQGRNPAIQYELGQ